MKKLLFILLLCFEFASGQMKEVDTLINGYHVFMFFLRRVDSSTTEHHNMIIYATDDGQSGTDTTLMTGYGLIKHWRTQDVGEPLADGKKRYPVYIVIQSSAFSRPWELQNTIDVLSTRFRATSALNRSATGFSSGAWKWSIYSTYQPTAGNYTYENYFKSMALYETVDPSDHFDATPTYPSGYSAYALQGGHLFAMHQSGSFTPSLQNVADTMNAHVSGSAFYQTTAFGDGTHGCCVDTIYGSGTVIPHKFTIGGITENIYQYMIRQMDTTLDIYPAVGGLAPFNQPTSCHTPVKYTINPTGTNEIYKPSGMGFSVQGGDTLLISNNGHNKYTDIILQEFHGGVGCPIVIIDSGKVRSQFMRINDASYFKLTGQGWAGHKYGFVLGDTLSSDPNSLGIGLCDHYEVDSVEAGLGSDVGFLFKKNPDSTNVYTMFPNYTINKVYIHDNYIHNTHGEGLYIGHTYPLADPYDNNLTPIEMDSVTIAYNIVDSTDWDGIQLSNARDGCSIHDNIVTNFGRIDMGAQRAGIIGGGNTSVRIYNNTVRFGTGNGIQGFGYGLLEIDHNTVDHAGRTHDDGCGGCQGEQAFFIKAQTIGTRVRPKQFPYIHDNNIISPMPRGILQTNNDDNWSDSAEFVNNFICYDVTIPANWATTKISISQATKIVTGNTATICNYTTPTANAGSNQTITLPTSSVTLTGFGTAGSGHTITGYNWQKISGPGATSIPNPNNSSVTATGLLAGVYIFRLTVTQDDSQTATSDVTVTVNAAPISPLDGLRRPTFLHRTIR